MRRSLIIVLFLLPLALHAQLLWEISGKGLPQSSYLFGTDDNVPVTFLDSVPGLFRCYNDCQTVVGEVVVDEAETIARMTNAAHMQQSIRNVLSESEFSMVDSALRAEMNLPLSSVAMMRPAMIRSMYEMTLMERLFPAMKEDGGMDSFFQRVARRQHIPVVGLEKIDDQIELMFRTIGIERQSKMLVGAVMAAAGKKEALQRRVAMYRAGNIEGIYEETVRDTSEYAMTEGERFLMYGSRNAEWVERIAELVGEKPCFIAVNVMHLPGEEGLIRLLEEKGYKVRAVK